MTEADLIELSALMSRFDQWNNKWLDVFWLPLPDEPGPDSETRRIAEGEYEEIEAADKPAIEALWKRIGFYCVVSRDTQTRKLEFHAFPYLHYLSTDGRTETKKHQYLNRCECGPSIEYYDAGTVIIHRKTGIDKRTECHV